MHVLLLIHLNPFLFNFDRLYSTRSNCDAGTLVQLRNLINRRNVAKDISGRFNESIDFFELIVNCHAIAAGMHFFGLNTIADQPRYNSFPMHQKSTESQWKALSTVLGKLVDRYVIVQCFQELQPHQPISVPRSVAHEIYNNPHAIRMRREHSYCAKISTLVASEHCYAKSADPNQP